MIIPEGTKVIQKLQNPDGSFFQKVWVIGKLLGRGGHGCCYEFSLPDPNSPKTACKIVEKARVKRENTKVKLMGEIKVH